MTGPALNIRHLRKTYETIRLSAGHGQVLREKAGRPASVTSTLAEAWNYGQNLCSRTSAAPLSPGAPARVRLVCGMTKIAVGDRLKWADNERNLPKSCTATSAAWLIKIISLLSK